MSAITSKVEICAMAMADLGNRNSITNIDTPRNDKEVICAQYYDIVRQYCLKTMMPNFALNRIVVSQKTVPAGYVNAYLYAYEYPQRCLKLLGIGNIDCTDGNTPTIENGLIFTNTLYQNGMPIRFVDDIILVPSMTAEFIMYFVKELAKRTALAITQDQGKKKQAIADAKEEAMNATALNAQENKPIRRSVSRWRQARSFFIRDDRSGSKP